MDPALVVLLVSTRKEVIFNCTGGTWLKMHAVGTNTFVINSVGSFWLFCTLNNHSLLHVIQIMYITERKCLTSCRGLFIKI